MALQGCHCADSPNRGFDLGVIDVGVDHVCPPSVEYE
jgi:hypothetical protein